MPCMPIRIRPFRPSDTTGVRAMFGRWSDRSTYQRFLSLSPSLADGYVDTLADEGRTLCAVVAVDDAGTIVGVGSTHRISRDRAEFGLAVDDSAQGRGVGTRLLAALLSDAHQQHVATLIAYVEPTNRQMLEVVLDELPDSTRERQADMVIVTVPVESAVLTHQCRFGSSRATPSTSRSQGS